MNSSDFSWMLGRAISVSLSEPYDWFFKLGDKSGIHVMCPWRLIEDGVIKISGEDHNQQFGLPAPIDATKRLSDVLANSRITKVEKRVGTADLLIDFGDGKRLEIIPFSCGYESWIVFTATRQIIAQGGGRLVEFNQ